MALTMLDKMPVKLEKSDWPPEIVAEFEREKQNPKRVALSPCFEAF